MLTFDDELESGFSLPTQQDKKNFETLPTALSPITFSASVDFRCGFFCRGFFREFFRGFFRGFLSWIFPWILFLLISRFSRLKFFTFFSTAFSTPFFTADFRGGILKRISSWVFWKFSCRPETRRGLVFPLPPYPAAATLKSCVINHMCIFGQSPAKNCLHQNAFFSKKPPRATTYVRNSVEPRLDCPGLFLDFFQDFSGIFPMIFTIKNRFLQKK